ncbi:hypothetical protein NHX12_033336 [Muraenolepis orangiensis]|uniref:Uncharacterized protein n=1 Tax=Muraenolepis orangiensis TaxID=630683 RepID=A0A9Q0E5B8_9TELE|nr:hypothetical protein NHX12_033336 [Muraenolepis orangiensis]
MSERHSEPASAAVVPLHCDGANAGLVTDHWDIESINSVHSSCGEAHPRTHCSIVGVARDNIATDPCQRSAASALCAVSTPIGPRRPSQMAPGHSGERLRGEHGFSGDVDPCDAIERSSGSMSPQACSCSSGERAAVSQY